MPVRSCLDPGFRSLTLRRVKGLGGDEGGASMVRGEASHQPALSPPRPAHKGEATVRAMGEWDQAGRYIRLRQELLASAQDLDRNPCGPLGLRASPERGSPVGARQPSPAG